MADLDEMHKHLVAAAHILRAQSSQLRNSVSSHVVPNTVAFSAIETFCVNAVKDGGPDAAQLFIGSLDGYIVVSARLRAQTGASHRPNKKKRARDDAEDRAHSACEKLLRHARSLEGEKCDRMVKQILTAQQTIEQLLRSVKGPNDEECFESCGVSMAATATTQASSNAPPAMPSRPRLIIACRLSAGVALPLYALRKALGCCFKDGMITTRPESIGPDYQLPLTEHGTVTEQQGQRSMLLFAAVPEE